MTTYARHHYGKDIWRNVVSDAARYKGLFFPFSNSLKRRTGLSTKTLYQANRQELDSLWNSQAKKLYLTEAKTINTKEKKTVTSYNNPHYLIDGSIAVEKRSYDQIPAFYALDKQGNETKICTPGVFSAPPNSTLSVSQSTLCWAERSYDPRWSYRNYSIIRTYDMKTGKKRQISSQSRYFSPSLSPDAQRIVTVEISEDLKYKLLILDANTGAILNVLPNAENWFYSFPCWTDDGENIVAVAQKGETSHLQLINIETANIQPLSPPSTYQISHPIVHGEHVYFSAAHTNIFNIFAIKMGEAAIYQLTSVLLGAFQPSVSPDGKMLAFSEFDINGYNIREMELEKALWKPFNIQKAQRSTAYAKTLEEQEGGSIIDKVPNHSYEIEKFNKWSGIIYPHSLLPYFDDPLIGLQLLSDNKFSTLSASIGGYYNYNDSDWTYAADISYAELYTLINLGFRNSARSAHVDNFSAYGDSSLIRNFYTEQWKENRLTTGLALPLNFSKGSFFNRLRLQANYQWIDINSYDNNYDDPENYRDTIETGRPAESFESIFREPLYEANLNGLDLRFTFSSYQRSALQHIYPRWGFRFDARYRSTLGGGDLKGDVFSSRADIFLPGLARNHSFHFIGAFRKEAELDNYRFSDYFVYPRGYNKNIADEYYRFGVNYHFPIWYPDLSIGPLAFVKRVKANVFYDHGLRKLNFPFEVQDVINSTGFELTFDFRAFRLLEIDIGVRYSYLLNKNFAPAQQQHQFDFLLLSISDQ